MIHRRRHRAPVDGPQLRSGRASRRWRACAAFALAVAVVGLLSQASAAAESDHALGIQRFMVGTTRAAVGSAIRTAEVKPLHFAFGVELLSEHFNGTDTTESVRITLPAGLSFAPRPAAPLALFPNSPPWGWTFSPASQSCDLAGRLALCTVAGVPGGTQVLGWVTDIVAGAAGSYAIRVEVTSAGANRAPRRLNDSATLTVLVGERSGTAAIGTPVLTRTRLRPSFVQADVKVTQGGVPVRPSSATCVARFTDDRRYGRVRSQGEFVLGAARCVFSFNNARYRGKTLSGEIAVVVGGKRVSKAFSVRLGPGNALERPVGATVDGAVAAKPKPSATNEWRGTLHLASSTGIPGKPPGHSSLDIRLTLLPGATKTDPLGWTQPVSWVATYSSSRYVDPPCTDSAGNPVPSDVGKRTVVRGRTGERPASNAKDYPRVGIRWDATRSQWVIALSFFGGSGGGMRLPLVISTTKNCGKTWISYTGTPGLQNLTIRAAGTATSTELKGTGTPTGFYNAKDTSVSWDLALGSTK